VDLQFAATTVTRVGAAAIAVSLATTSKQHKNEGDCWFNVDRVA